MKVGINARTFTTFEPGGSVQAAIEVTKRLIDHPETDVVLFGRQSIDHIFSDVDVVGSLYATENREFGVMWERLVLPYLARKHDIDVLFAPNGNGPLTTQPFSIVMWVHDVGSKKGWMSPIHRLYRNTTVPRASSIADRIVTPSKFSKREIIDEIGVEPKKIDVIYNGVDEYFRSAPDETSLRLPDEYVLFVSSALEFGNRKNLKAVIDVYEYIIRNYTIDHKLVLVGKEKEDIFDEININSDRIIVTGYVDKNDLKFAYTQADVFLFPSLHEGFGMPPLEAMACGTPVVASNSASVPEVVGDAGKLVDPNNTELFSEAIMEILRNEGLRQDLISKGLQRCKQFTWQETTNKVMDSLKKAEQDK